MDSGPSADELGATQEAFLAEEGTKNRPRDAQLLTPVVKNEKNELLVRCLFFLRVCRRQEVLSRKLMRDRNHAPAKPQKSMLPRRKNQ
jgi:hypothetical protein